MAIKKSQLYSTLWESCNVLRGGMDATQYKDYVLVMLFVKYISDKKDDPNTIITVPEGCTFNDFVELKNKTNIGEEINTKLAKIAEANGLVGVIDNADFNDENKLGKGENKIKTISQLIKVFQNENLDFSKNRAADDDLIGDAYEYLMRQFATESGKSKGQFYTPAEVSRVMARVIGINKDERAQISIYDPTCGSGSLLLRARAEVKNDASIEGQEYDGPTIGMAKMSMIIHGVDDADLRHGDTINSPLHTNGWDVLDTFDYVVANPPFSDKGWLKTVGTDDKYKRWGSDSKLPPCPPESNGDYAYLLHIIKSMKSTGHGACILPHGVLFRGNSEGEIREFLLTKSKVISGIIGLPQNLFYGTGIPACIIILDKENAINSDGIFMIDAKDGFIKDGSKNRLREQDIRRIIDTWESKEEIPHYSRFVKYSEIEANGYNLNIPRYIVPVDTEIHHNLTAHLHGGLPSYDIDECMSHYWTTCPTLKDQLFKTDNREFYSLIPLEEDVSCIVENNSDFKQQVCNYSALINEWCNARIPEFNQLTIGINPKQLITTWGTTLLNSFKQENSLVEPYNVYEILLHYWNEIMQDDCYLISRDGWKASLTVATIKKIDKEKKEIRYEPKKNPTYQDLVCDLLPVSVVIRVYYSVEEQNIINLANSIESLSSELDTLVEEHPQDFSSSWYSNAKSVQQRLKSAKIRKAQEGETEILQGILPLFGNGKELKNKRQQYVSNYSSIFSQFDTVTKTKVTNRIKEIPLFDPLMPDTVMLLENYCEINQQITEQKKNQKEAIQSLTSIVVSKYEEMSSREIQNLVINEKWIYAIKEQASAEIKRICRQITLDVLTLNRRYKTTLPQLIKSASGKETVVLDHLVKMGFSL